MSLVRLPLYILTEAIVLVDILYFLNIKDSVGLVNGAENKHKIPNLVILCVKTVFLCIIGTMIIIYSSITPHSSEGTPVNSIFCLVHVHLFTTHMIIFSKLFLTSKITWYKLILLIIQVGSYYIGILIIS